jgi:hypothetical protein
MFMEKALEKFNTLLLLLLLDEASLFILPLVNDPVLRPLQEGILICMDTLQRVLHN